MELDWIPKWWGVITTGVAILATVVMLWLSKTFARREELKEVSTAMDELSTRGLSLFMTLPGPGEPLQNFNLMNNAAKKLAEEFGGQVLDGQRSVLTVQTVRHYVERIREFQRQQLIRG